MYKFCTTIVEFLEQIIISFLQVLVNVMIKNTVNLRTRWRRQYGQRSTQKAVLRFELIHQCKYQNENSPNSCHILIIVGYTEKPSGDSSKREEEPRPRPCSSECEKEHAGASSMPQCVSCHATLFHVNYYMFNVHVYDKHLMIYRQLMVWVTSADAPARLCNYWSVTVYVCTGQLQ